MAEKNQRTILTSKQRKELAGTLNNFYHNPVAQVSFELFLTIGLIIFLGVFAIKPTIQTMSDLIKEIENKEKLEKQLTQKIAALQTAQAELITITPLLPSLDEAIPSNPEIIRSAKIIEKMATDSKVVIRSMGLSGVPNDAPEGTTFAEKSKQNLVFSMSIAGDYLSIREFVETMRNSKKSFIVSAVNFSLEEKRGEESLSATVIVDVPYFGLTPSKE